MRNIEGSDWLQHPDLQVIAAATKGQSGSSFTLFADQVTTAGSDTDSGAGGGKGKGKVPGNKVVASRGAQ
jgi:hypothetical protein